MELEFRLGFVTNGRFSPGLPKILWTSLLKRYEDAPGVVMKKTTSIESYVKRKDETARFVTYDDGTSKWEYKKHIFKETTESSKGHACMIRASLSLETTGEGEAPPSANIILRRTKKRTSFRDGPWSVDFTIVESVPCHDKDCEETYEVEVELADVGCLFDTELHILVENGYSTTRNLLI